MVFKFFCGCVIISKSGHGTLTSNRPYRRVHRVTVLISFQEFKSKVEFMASLTYTFGLVPQNYDAPTRPN